MYCAVPNGVNVVGMAYAETLHPDNPTTPNLAVFRRVEKTTTSSGGGAVSASKPTPASAETDTDAPARPGEPGPQSAQQPPEYEPNLAESVPFAAHLPDAPGAVGLIPEEERQRARAGSGPDATPPDSTPGVDTADPAINAQAPTASPQSVGPADRPAPPAEPGTAEQ